MKVEVKDVSKVEKMVEIEVPAEQVEDEVKEKFDEIQRTATIKGFRPGKAPRKLVERLFKDYIGDMVVKKLIEDTLNTALERKNLKPVVEPVVDPAELKEGEPYTYTVHVEVKPEIELGEYKGLTVTHKDQAVSDEDVIQALDGIRESAALLKAPEPPRPAGKEDQVTADVTIKEGDEELYKRENEAVELWRGSWIPGLPERLSGRSTGETVEFSARTAEDQTVPEKFRGKELNFAFAIKDIKERILPELNDDFAKEYTKHETLDELKEMIRTRLNERTDQQNRSARQNAVLQALVEKNPVEVPPTLIKKEAQALAREFIGQNFRRNPTESEVDQFHGMFLAEAKSIFEANYILDAVASKENIEATDEDFEARINEQAEMARMHPDKLKARLTDEEKEAMKWRIRLDKTLDFLVADATIKE